MRHAVDLPVELAVFVADLDGESAIICANNLDEFASLALDLQLLLFAGVERALASLAGFRLLLLLIIGRR